jgi:hypothetical protein
MEAGLVWRYTFLEFLLPDLLAEFRALAGKCGSLS